MKNLGSGIQVGDVSAFDQMITDLIKNDSNHHAATNHDSSWNVGNFLTSFAQNDETYQTQAFCRLDRVDN